MSDVLKMAIAVVILIAMYAWPFLYLANLYADAEQAMRIRYGTSGN